MGQEVLLLGWVLILEEVLECLHFSMESLATNQPVQGEEGKGKEEIKRKRIGKGRREECKER